MDWQKDVAQELAEVDEVYLQQMQPVQTLLCLKLGGGSPVKLPVARWRSMMLDAPKVAHLKLMGFSVSFVSSRSEPLSSCTYDSGQETNAAGHRPHRGDQTSTVPTSQQQIHNGFCYVTKERIDS